MNVIDLVSEEEGEEELESAPIEIESDEESDDELTNIMAELMELEAKVEAQRQRLREEEERAELEQMERQRQRELEQLEQRRAAEAIEAAKAAQAAQGVKAAAVDAARYRELRQTLLMGARPKEETVRALRQLREVLAAQDRSPKASPTIGQNFPITPAENAFLGQFPVWGPGVKVASPKQKYELVQRKKEREHEFLRRSLAFEKTRPRVKSAVVLITMHGAFWPDRRTTVPANMVVTRGSLSSPGALRFGTERKCPAVAAQWEYKVIRKGLQTYKALFPADPELLNPADFFNLIEAEMNAQCTRTYVPLIEQDPFVGKNAFCSEHVGLQYMMYQGGEQMAFKEFMRKQSVNEHEFNIYVIDMAGKTTKLLPDKPLYQATNSTEILNRVRAMGYTNVILLDMSCQSFLSTPEEKQREVAGRFGRAFLLGGGQKLY